MGKFILNIQDVWKVILLISLNVVKRLITFCQIDFKECFEILKIKAFAKNSPIVLLSLWPENALFWRPHFLNSWRTLRLLFPLLKRHLLKVHVF
jgi:hypothetical protein